MLRKLMEAEEKKDDATAAEEVSPPTEEAPAEAPVEEPTPPEETPAEETPPADAPEETPPAEAPEEVPAEETTTEKPKDESEKSAEKIEDLSKEPTVGDYGLAKQLKSLYEGILNASTLKERAKAEKEYKKVIDNLEINDKIRDALEKVIPFIKPGDKELADYISKKLKK